MIKFLDGIELPDALQTDFLLLLRSAFQTLKKNFGAKLIDTIEQISLISIENYHNPHLALEKIESYIHPYSYLDKSRLISCYSIIFHLLNAAEKLHICRINRERDKDRTRKNTVTQAIQHLTDLLPEDKLVESLSKLSIIPTITAHPTEARRLTVLYKLDEIAKNLAAFHNPDRTERESLTFKNKVERSVMLLAATSSLRDSKPDPLQEVHFALHYLSGPIWQIVPELYLDFYYALPSNLKQEICNNKIISFRSWIGGDRDGNPNITNSITKNTLSILRKRIIELYRNDLKRLRRDISISSIKVTPPSILLESIKSDQEMLGGHQPPIYLSNEPFRYKLDLIDLKIERAISEREFYHATDLTNDLNLIKESLKEVGYDEIAENGSTLFNCLSRLKVFGFHFASLDIRQHSAVHESVIEEIFQQAQITQNYKKLKESEKVDLLMQYLISSESILFDFEQLSFQTQEMLNLFKLIREEKEHNPEVIQSYIISMTHSCSDLLEVLLLMKQSGLRKKVGQEWQSTLHIVPLFETISDLENCKDLFEEFLKNPVYKEHLISLGNFQEIMLGYSDSNKDGGYLISTLLLQKACLKLSYTAEQHGIRLGIFHGRGGTIARGGGRSVNAIKLSSGTKSNGYIRFTEQGEVISFRYGLAALAHRHLEQIMHAILTQGSKPIQKLKPEESQLLNKLSNISFKSYRTLIDHKDFWEWYIKTTPVEFISKLPIASRPVSRSASQVDFEGLRAIPWGFAWNQSRFMVPSWYGVGSALQEINLETLKDDYSSEPFFKVVIDSLELELARSRICIGERYAKDSSCTITEMIKAEHNTTMKAVLLIKDESILLENRGLIRNLIILRNRHLDAVHILQRLLIEEFRETKSENDRLILERYILESINTIAAALQTTG